jgi:hypothetical protein
LITLAVGGDEPTTVSVDQDVLVGTSDFFKNAMKPSLRNDPHTVDLSDDSLVIVQLYVNWLCGCIIPMILHHSVDSESRERSVAESEKVYRTLEEAYIFGDKILDTAFRDAVMICWNMHTSG